MIFHGSQTERSHCLYHRRIQRNRQGNHLSLPGERNPGAITARNRTFLEEPSEELKGLSLSLRSVAHVALFCFSNQDSVAKGIADTAGLVNGAAAIMIAVFAAFSLVEIRIVSELGFGLVVSILLDATLVRSVLVPTSMRLLGNAN